MLTDTLLPLMCTPCLPAADWDWGLNCIHGVQSSCVKANDGSGTIYCPTSFPNPVNYGA